MAGQEARINDALKQLGEEYRLGMVQVAEYRSRRKLLVDGWGERDVTTSPRKSKTATATGPALHRPAAPPPAPEPRTNPIPMLIVGAALLAIAGGAWYVLGHKAPTGNVPAIAPMSPAAQAIRKAADDFIRQNAWDADSVNAFVSQWRALDAADRARVADEPEIRTLRYRLDQNIQAEMQLITPDSTPEQRAQLVLLQGFSAALAGGS